MAFVGSVEFDGFSDALATLGKLSGDELDRTITQALKDGAAKIIASAKGRVPVDTGALRESIRTHEPKKFHDAIATRVLAGSQVVKGAGPKGTSAIVGANALGDPYYAHMVEYGHKIGKRPKGLKHKRRRQAPVVDTRTKEVPAQPFMRPAFDEQREAVNALIEERLHAFAEKQWSK